MKNKMFLKLTFSIVVVLFTTACQDKFEEFPNNPNVSGETAPVPPSFLLRQLLTDVGRGADVTEGPLEYLSRLNQFTTGLTFPLYGGSNQYNWSQTGVTYPWLRNIIKLEESAQRAIGPNKNGYLALAKFLRAYSFIWLTQRVGDIPMTEAGLGLENLTPKFDTQEAVYAQCFALLEEANNDLAIILADATSPRIDGDIYFNNNLANWRKAVNAFTLRTLISLSKRADDTPALGIKQKFNDIVSNPTKYPLFTSNADNLRFTFIPVFNRYPTQFLKLYPRETCISKTFLDLTTQYEDPRTFIAATPAPGAITAGKTIHDFTAYKGADNSRPQVQLFAESESATLGIYSYLNNIRYLGGPDVIPEPFIILGYAEMKFNIAEAINRGWISGDAGDEYLKGIQASLAFYGLSNGSKVRVGDVNGAFIGEVTVNVTKFLENVAYLGNNADGLRQILEQKYVAFWQNSGWEPFYQFRRTGIPAFAQGSATNSQGQIPRRWLYPIEEVQNNSTNAEAAIQRQFDGTETVFKDTWLTK